jgi:hypothetical protein
MLYAALNQSIIIAFGESNPFKATSDKKMEFFNESMIMITGYH